MKNSHLLRCLSLRRCDVAIATPHSLSLRTPCIWLFLISLGDAWWWDDKKPVCP